MFAPGARTPRPPGIAGKRVPCGHLPPKGAKRPEGGERNDRRARSALAAKIEVADLRALQTSRKKFANSLSPPQADFFDTSKSEKGGTPP